MSIYIYRLRVESTEAEYAEIYQCRVRWPGDDAGIVGSVEVWDTALALMKFGTLQRHF
jgi:hypothetical protein